MHWDLKQVYPQFDEILWEATPWHLDHIFILEKSEMQVLYDRMLKLISLGFVPKIRIAQT